MTGPSEKPPLDPERFDLPEDGVWALHCADGPSPIAGAEAATVMLGREVRPWELRIDRDFEGLTARVRRAGAAVLGGRVEDVALTGTTSSGLVTIAQSYPWRPGDIVVTPLGEFPSNVWPWRALAARGVDIVEVPLWDDHRAGAAAESSSPPSAEADPEGRLLDALDRHPASRVLTASWVRFQDGLVLDLDRLAEGCRERGVDFIVDGIQGAGTLPLAADRLAGRGLRAFATGGHKGLLGVHGAGLLWTAPSLRERLVPSGSWLSVEDGYDFSRPNTDLDRAWLADGRRLEQGVPNLLGCAVFAESLELLADAGVDRIAGHIAVLRGGLLLHIGGSPSWSADGERLRALDAAGRLGSVIAVHHHGLGDSGLYALVRRGRRRGLFTSVREGYLRIALHGYHHDADVDRLVDGLISDG
ncbi:MAG: aminotransferase class V-fold PLP-dependent enzyme [Acidobacteriota bacterium]